MSQRTYIIIFYKTKDNENKNLHPDLGGTRSQCLP